MSGRGGGRGRGGGTGGRGSGGGRAGGGGGRGQPLTPVGPTGGNAPPVFGSGVSFPALGSGSGRPVVGSTSSVSGGPMVGSSASITGPARPVVGSSSVTGGPMVGSSSSTAGPARPVATQETEVAQLEKKVQAMEVAPKGPPSSSKSVRPPLRPGYGTLGKKTVVKANHFLVKVAATDIHLYDVSITPEVRSKKVNRDIMKQLQVNYRASHLGNKMLAYDGVKGAYTAGALPFSSKEFVVKLPDSRREREFKVAMKFAAKVDVSHLRMFIERRTLDSPQEVIQALDVVLRETPSNTYEVVGRSFFHPSLGQQGTLGNGVEFWRGYYQSIRPTQMGLSLNIDISATGFYEPIGVIEFLTSNLNVRDFSRGLSDQDRIKLKKALRNVRVEVTHNDTGRRYKITNVTNQPISQLSFSQNGTPTTIVQYFKETYNCHLRHINLPALVTGSAEKPIHLPMEVCKIVKGQKYSKKLNERQVTALLNACCQRPQDREYGIKNMVKGRNYNTDGLLTGFGFQISTELTNVNARVLEPPKIMYHNTGKDALTQPMVGQWNMINKKMVNGGRVARWGFVNFSRRITAAVQFCDDLIRMCTAKGMAFNPEPFIRPANEPAGHVEKTLYDIGKRCRENSIHLQLLIIILPDISGQYGTIKRIFETELDIVSQCCNPNKVLKSNQQYLENVALKINVKVGGRNSVLQEAIQRTIPFLTDRVTIIFGADVTHPQPGEDYAPSIASVVASMDWPEVTKYRSLVSAQHHRKEIIQDLYTTDESGSKPMGMIRDHLIAFKKSTGRKPDRIIFYRDGVSEGQFKDVLLHEIDSIRKACVSLETNYLPPITFVVVQKRHHTRFFPANHGDKGTTDRSGNILPGTVVDTQICHPTEFDFYLCSHAGIKGTSRPTHYHVLYDENRFDANSLQKLTYHLCYTYARCTRAVSIVPPAYYAHLAAFRARYYVEGLYSDSGSHAGRSATREQNVPPQKLPSVQAGVKEVMFYC